MYTIKKLRREEGGAGGRREEEEGRGGGEKNPLLHISVALHMGHRQIIDSCIAQAIPL